ncbi:MAG: ogr/Delta-like zinc finger family protein [Exilibacterium sp.]
MLIKCPFCQSRAITRTSKRPSPVFYEIYSYCGNPECGWAGKLLIEFTLTTRPSLLNDDQVNIPMESHSRQRLLKQLIADSH